MANNRGTLNGVPQQPAGVSNNLCNTCGMTFDSSDSLQVHIHYHHAENSQNRWNRTSSSVTSNASNSPTDSENNNQPKLYSFKQSKNVSSTLNSTISAAADSSDNQPSTPQPSVTTNQLQSNRCSPHPHVFNPPIQNQSQHQHYQLHQPPADIHYANYIQNNYDHYYHQHAMDYGISTPPTHFPGNSQALPLSQLHHEYKQVPSTTRFHPYGHHHESSSLSQAHHNYHPQVVSTQSAISPRIIPCSPIQTNAMHSTTASKMKTRMLTPSPTTRQCDRCGLVCDSVQQLNEHHKTHSSATESGTDPNDLPNHSVENEVSSYQYAGYVCKNVKEEPECDILDLDSQKMIYSPHDVDQPQRGALPPMNSLHPGQRSLMWTHEFPHDFASATASTTENRTQEIKSEVYNFAKHEYSPQILKPESGQLMAQITSNQESKLNNHKSYVSDGSSNQVATSPSEFPSTTTPQESGTQFRTYEAASSSLSNSGSAIKASTWKSNEARRPKTYNCTACNKWFTSSGHLKRHYNTTLHKNAVKSSGQPDPASMPISVHHHPARDPNNKHSHRHNNTNSNNPNHVTMSQQQLSHQQQPAQQLLLSESARSQNFQPQYSPSALGFQHQHTVENVGYPEYRSQTQIQSNTAIPPNEQAGLSVHAFQPRDLLNYSNTMGTHLYQEQHIHPQHQQQQRQPLESEQVLRSAQDSIQATPPLESAQSTITINTAEATVPPYSIITPITINTNITQLYQDMQAPDQSQMIFHTNTGDELTSIDEVNNIASDRNMLARIDESNDRMNVLQYYNNDEIMISTTTSMSGGIQRAPSQQHHHLPRNEYADHVYQNCEELIEYRGNRMMVGSSKIPLISALRGLNGETYHADTVPPFSPDVPSTLETGEIVMTHLSQCAPSSLQHSDKLQLAKSAPLDAPDSPRVSSTNSTIDIETVSGTSNGKNRTKSLNGANKRRAKRSNSNSNSETGMPIVTDCGSDALRCIPCDKVFNKACYFTQHNKNIHSGHKPYKCQRCGKRFPCNQSHDEHLAKHIGNKPFKCNQCTKMFNHKTDLRRHTHLHTGTKPYSCCICNKGFIRKDHMVKHGLTHLKRKQSDVKNEVVAKSPTNKDTNKTTSKRNAVVNANRKKNKIIKEEDHLDLK